MSGNKISRTIDVDLALTPEELADAFWGMNDTEQARFFNTVGVIAQTEFTDFSMQLAAVTSNDILLGTGRRAMELIGEYSSKT